MPWIGPAISIGTSLLTGGDGGGGGGYSSNQGSGGPQYYIPTGLSSADTNWQNAYGQAENLANNANTQTLPLYQKTLAAQNAINYQPWQSAAIDVSHQYDWLNTIASQQGNQYGDAANRASGQQQSLYGAGNQVYQTALDPQNALYGRTQQQLQDQVRAGQAARGLGNSAVGAAEENQAMSNFNIDWQNQQLARQAQGLQAMGQASNAGGAQGQLYGADMAAQMASYGAIPGNTMQSGQIQAKTAQEIANMPAQNAAAYASNLANNQALYGQLMNQSIPYMNYGTGATNGAYNAFSGQQANQNQQSAAMGNAIGGIVSQSGLGGWLNKNIFGGGNTGYDGGYGMPTGGGYNQSTADWMSSQGLW